MTNVPARRIAKFVLIPGTVFSVILAAAALLIISSSVRAQSLEPYDVAKKLQQTYDKAANLVAEFRQKTSLKFSDRVRQGSGSVLFLKPGHMRWDYFTPDRQVIISDGETISMYFEKNSQMIISNARDYLQSDVTYSFFAGTGNILEDFEIEKPDFENQDEEYHLIKLIPKSAHPNVAYLHVWIAAETFMPEHLQIVDHFDTVTDIYFDNLKIDSARYGDREITKNIFSFIPPPQTEIIKQY